MTTLREAATRALQAMEAADVDPHSSDAIYKAGIALRAALAEHHCDTHCTWADHDQGCVRAEPVQEPAAWQWLDTGTFRKKLPKTAERCAWNPLYAAPPQRLPLTVERLRDALVASRIVPPAAVEDPDGYDDGVTLHRIEALHRRLT